MKQEKWADLMSNLMKIAEDLFSSVKDFKKGKLVAEVEAEVNVRIEIARDSEGRINAGLTILPLEKEEQAKEQKEEKQATPLPPSPPSIEKGEDIKPDIEMLDVDEGFENKNNNYGF